MLVYTKECKNGGQKQHEYTKTKQLRGGGRFLSLVALAIILLGFAAPAHADSINLSFDTSNATLRGNGKYLRYKNVVTVDNSNSYGFTLSMYANNPDLVNSSDSNYVINLSLIHI